jgi:hypothetical protein
MAEACPVSPSELKAYAIKHKTTEIYGPLTVTSEGMFVIKGRKASLNDAIIAIGRHWKAAA